MAHLRFDTAFVALVKRGPPAAAVKLGLGAVEGVAAAGTREVPLFGVELVVLPGPRGLRALLPQDVVLHGAERLPPLRVALEDLQTQRALHELSRTRQHAPKGHPVRRAGGGVVQKFSSVLGPSTCGVSGGGGGGGWAEVTLELIVATRARVRRAKMFGLLETRGASRFEVMGQAEENFSAAL